MSCMGLPLIPTRALIKLASAQVPIITDTPVIIESPVFDASSIPANVSESVLRCCFVLAIILLEIVVSFILFILEIILKPGD